MAVCEIWDVRGRLDHPIDLSLIHISDFIRDLDRYEKDLLSAVERSDLADVTTDNAMPL